MRAPAVWQGLATNVSLLRVRRAGPGGTVYRVLNPAPAEDSDSITVTRATAAKYKLKSIADPPATAAMPRVRPAIRAGSRLSVRPANVPPRCPRSNHGPA